MGLTFLAVSLSATQAYATFNTTDCYTGDFTSGSWSTYKRADDCALVVGEESEATINSQSWDLGSDWNFTAGFEVGVGTTAGSLFDILIDPKMGWMGVIKYYEWSFPQENFYKNQEYLFTVKQENEEGRTPGATVAYYFDPLSDNEGKFDGGGILRANEFSTLNIYTKSSGGNVTSVPEISAGNMGLALALLLGLTALFRERRAS